VRESALGRAKRAARAKSRSQWRDAVLERDGWRCRLAGVVIACNGRLHAHHVLPRSRGGRDDLGNGLTACDSHHSWIHAHPEWAYTEGYLLRTPPSTLQKPLSCSCGHPAADHAEWEHLDAVRCNYGCEPAVCIGGAS